MPTDRYICIHGHFYQPPRENPWLEAIEVQDSAYPFHDWNERIEAECYRSNAAARILDGEGRIERIANNYGRISFNVGPTLLSWLEEQAPETYAAIRRADRLSAERFSGHGSAMAQAYNHIIMPLASHRDRVTQVRWGLVDFEQRFRRKPEGMWLPETAVDLDSLEVLAEHGVRFTVLAPSQAARVRKVGEKTWHDVSGARIDPSRAYLQRLPSGRSIALFFYDGPVSRAVAFENLLSSGEYFAGRIASTFSDDRKGAQLAHIATDGETYGHHHRHGEMALAYALEHIEQSGLARLTNYGEFLERHPPAHEVEILENTAWSCAHGVDRWRADCGCHTGGGPGWNQAWRAPLREALDWLRDELAPRFDAEARNFLKDPWEARDDYIQVVLDRSRENVQAFLERHQVRPLTGDEPSRVLRLLELQRYAMLMYTSCGWFFNDLSGIETVQVLQYAGRAVQLAQGLFGNGLEARFLERLSRARSNVAAAGDGREIYQRHVQPSRVDLAGVAAHWAINSLFEDYEDTGRVYCYETRREDAREQEAGRARLLVGRVRVTSRITWEAARFSLGVVHFGDHNLSAGVRPYEGDEAYRRMADAMLEAFERADLAESVRRLDDHFGARPYALRSLFRDEQRRVLGRILDTTLSDAEGSYRRLYNTYAPLMRFVHGLGAPLPRALKTAAEYVINTDLRRLLENDEVAGPDVLRLMDTAKAWALELDTPGLAFALNGSLGRLADALRAEPTDLEVVEALDATIRRMQSLPFPVDLFRVQNVVWELLQAVQPEQRVRAGAGDLQAGEWISRFGALGATLGMQLQPRRRRGERV